MAPTMARCDGKGVRRSWMVSLLMVSLFFPACDGSEEGISLQKDPRLMERAQQAIRNGVAVPLRQITEGEWDRVHVFPGPTTQESVTSIIGATVDMPDIHPGGIVVFMKGNTVERAVEVLPYPFDGNGGSYGTNVIATPMPTGDDARWLRLTEEPP